jgi:hypothetical protein
MTAMLFSVDWIIGVVRQARLALNGPLCAALGVGYCSMLLVLRVVTLGEVAAAGQAIGSRGTDI